MLYDLMSIYSSRRMSYYAVKVGRVPGIYRTWAECEKQVHGYSKARFKKFGTLEEAADFAIIDLEHETRSNDATGSTTKIPLVHHKTITKTKMKTKVRIIPDPNDSFRRKETSPVNSENFPSKLTVRQQFVIRKDLPQTAVVYTHGCCIRSGQGIVIGGIGVYWAPHHPNNISELVNLPNLSDNVVELRAASRALESAVSLGLKSVEVRTCNKCTKQTISEWKRDNSRASANDRISNVEEILRLDDVCQKIDVSWVYLAGPEGVYGSQEAARLAREGTAKS